MYRCVSVCVVHVCVCMCVCICMKHGVALSFNVKTEKNF